MESFKHSQIEVEGKLYGYWRMSDGSLYDRIRSESSWKQPSLKKGSPQYNKVMKAILSK